MDNQTVRLWAIRSVDYTPGPDPEEPKRGSSEIELITLYYEEARAKEALRLCQQDPYCRHAELTALEVPAGYVCWVVYRYDDDGSIHICSDINFSSFVEWCALEERYEEALAMGARYREKPVWITPVE